MWITSSTEAAKTPTNIALGNFDGVHLGHQRVMAQILEKTNLDGSTLDGSALDSPASDSSFLDEVKSNGKAAKILSARSIAALQDSAIASGYSQLISEFDPYSSNANSARNVLDGQATQQSSPFYRTLKNISLAWPNHY